jgi:arylformamidase
MIIQLTHNNKNYSTDLSHPLDISLPLRAGAENPNCYWADPVKFETITSGNFIGSVKAGGSVNYQKVTFTPHGNGTHTECYGHISADDATLPQCHRLFHCVAQVISVAPEKTADNDQVITLHQVKEKISGHTPEAIVIRTLPNDSVKRTKQYSGTNPPYIDASVTEYLANQNIEHLLIDLPSIDKEMDGGRLAAHKAFWNYPHATRKHCTITELVYVEDAIPDGLYLLNLQIASFELDASPSKPILYKLEEVS